MTAISTSSTDLNSSGQHQHRRAIAESFRQLGLIVGCQLPAVQRLLGSLDIIQQPSPTGLCRLNALLHS